MQELISAVQQNDGYVEDGGCCDNNDCFDNPCSSHCDSYCDKDDDGCWDKP